MAAPEGIVWGDIVGGSTNGRQGRLGIYTSVTSTNTETTVNVQVWFWTIYSCSDGYNTLYYNAGTSVSSATTSMGAVDIEHSVASGSGWDTDNQTRVLNKTYKYTRGTSNTTYKVYAKLADIDILSGAVYANTSYTVPKLASYTVSYNANDGGGAPSNQTKWYGIDLTLSNTRPTRTGYSFQGWATSASGSVVYAPGGSYTANAGTTLYAVWKANTYKVSYNANGGSGAPGQQTKTYGVTLKLSSTIPTRANYNFLGWADSASATSATYVAGSNYTANAAITLYAVWELAYVKPIINLERVERYDIDDNGDEIDGGRHVWITGSYVCDREPASEKIEFESETTGSISVDIQAVGTQGEDGKWYGNIDFVSTYYGDVVLNPDITYTVKYTVADELGYTTKIFTLPGTAYTLDFLSGGKGAAFGKAAELENVLDIAFQTRAFGGFLHPVLEPETNLDEVLIPNTYVGANISTNHYGGDCPLTSGTFTLEVVGAGEEGQLKQRLTHCHKTASKTWERIYHRSEGVMSWGEWVCVSDFGGQLLWDGAYYMTETHAANLSDSVSNQKTGIVLVFSQYDAENKAALNADFSCHFIPKLMISRHGGSLFTFVLATADFGYVGTKTVAVSDEVVAGTEYNDHVGTHSGIDNKNNRFVLRYVIGV